METVWAEARATELEYRKLAQQMSDKGYRVVSESNPLCVAGGALDTRKIEEDASMDGFKVRVLGWGGKTLIELFRVGWVEKT